MIVTDLDNTLLRTDETISDYTVSVFRRCRDKGIKIAFATARNLLSSAIYREIIDPDGDIVTGGCLILARTELLKSIFLPTVQSTMLLNELSRHPSIKSISARSLNQAYSSIPIEGRICIDFSSNLPEDLLHCSCRTDDDRYIKSLANRYDDLSFLHVSDSDLYDINPKEATKSNGVKIIAEYFKIPLAKVVAFGDDFNDISMLKDCGIGIAMGNAIDECKEVADYICDTNDNDGMARWLETYLL